MSSILRVVVLLVITVCIGGAPRRCAAAPRPTDSMDIRAMQAIAKSTGADKSLGWGVKSGDPCDGTWSGVRCNDDGRVTSIDASNGGLVGTLSGTDLSGLGALTSLDLSRNQIGDYLPALPEPLTELKNLNLSSNSFFDIPDYFFFSFPALETFAIDDNRVISGDIPEDLVRCPALRIFSANNVTLYGVFPEFLGNGTIFPALERLSLARNQLFGDMPLEAWNSSKIKFLDVSSQSVDDIDESFSDRLDFVTGMTDLVEIHIAGNSFYGPLPDLSGLANLKVFDAANNNLCGKLNFPQRVAVHVDGNPGVGKDC
ncbi:hypothetical protein QOZ80_3BG0265650 [Eleusine coracana subsp. coracana]|nr:hypothetical protein QOZ80_3BG0265650 [Eleusine coracana subsp. coracana]